jgi:hypothetical protein
MSYISQAYNNQQVGQWEFYIIYTMYLGVL